MKVAQMENPERGTLHGRDWIQVGWIDDDTQDMYCDDCVPNTDTHDVHPLTEFEDCLNAENFDEKYACSECGALFIDLGEELGTCDDCHRSVFFEQRHTANDRHFAHTLCGSN